MTSAAKPLTAAEKAEARTLAGIRQVYAAQRAIQSVEYNHGGRDALLAAYRDASAEFDRKYGGGTAVPSQDVIAAALWK